MASNMVSIEGDILFVEPLGAANKIFGFQGKMEIPLAHIVSARLGRGILDEGAWRIAGTSIPGKQVGNYSANAHTAYVNVSRSEDSLELELVDECLDLFVLGCENSQ